MSVSSAIGKKSLHGRTPRRDVRRGDVDQEPACWSHEMTKVRRSQTKMQRFLHVAVLEIDVGDRDRNEDAPHKLCLSKVMGTRPAKK